MRIIINADDFGKNAEVNKAIERCIAEKFITSTTIMANGECVKSAVNYALSHPEISYGVHLVIDELESLTKPQIFVKAGITDESGNFVKGCLTKVKPSKEIKEAIYKEWHEQVDTIINMGLTPTHIDSHHHVHTIPWVLPIIKKISNTFGIKKVRLTQHRSISILRKHSYQANNTTGANTDQKCNDVNSESHAKLLQKFYKYFRLLHKHIKGYIHTQKIRSYFKTTDFFCSVSYYINNKKLIDSKYDMIELMCHPGHKDYEEETKMLGTIRGSLISYIEL